MSSSPYSSCPSSSPEFDEGQSGTSMSMPIFSIITPTLTPSSASTTSSITVGYPEEAIRQASGLARAEEPKPKVELQPQPKPTPYQSRPLHQDQEDLHLQLHDRAPSGLVHVSLPLVPKPLKP
ncbi:hypothetical protein AMTR_s00161p00055510 [Amborella trichopoda]|uniref:Uncharacterized protein n=1 Tax=Amborella trichopoda TaxID=13333 RepID=W1PQZ7_AMBTC|nr:hypothetical protein AMTR_s00161p00055510 [Amborella trichopoda]